MTRIDPELPDARFMDDRFRRLEERVGKHVPKEGTKLPGFREPVTAEMVAYDLAWAMYHALRPDDGSTDRFNETGTLRPFLSGRDDYIAFISRVAEKTGLCDNDGQFTSEAVRLRGALQKFYDTDDPD